MERKIVIGGKEQIKGALLNYEEFEKLNAYFIERLNLTIRRNSSCLHRNTPSMPDMATGWLGNLIFKEAITILCGALFVKCSDLTVTTLYDSMLAQIS